MPEAADSVVAFDFTSLHRGTMIRAAAERKVYLEAPRVKQVETPSAHGDHFDLPKDHSAAPVAER